MREVEARKQQLEDELQAAEERRLAALESRKQPARLAQTFPAGSSKPLSPQFGPC